MAKGRTGGGRLLAGYYIGEKAPRSRDRRRGRLSENRRRVLRRRRRHLQRAVLRSAGEFFKGQA